MSQDAETVGQALGLFISCIRSGEGWSAECEKARSSALDALRRLGSSEWRPIETAPKDGTSILLWSPEWEETFGVVIGERVDSGWMGSDFDTSDWSNAEQPTRWMPIPTPPA